MPNAQYIFNPPGGTSRINFNFTYQPNTGQLYVLKNGQHKVVPYDYLEPDQHYIDFVSPFTTGDKILVQVFTVIPINRPEIFNLGNNITRIVLNHITYIPGRYELQVSKNGAGLVSDYDYFEFDYKTIDLLSASVAGDRIVVRSLRAAPLDRPDLGVKALEIKDSPKLQSGDPKEISDRPKIRFS